MEKQSRVSLNLRTAPADAAEFTARARAQGRSLGEQFALMLAKLRSLEAARPAPAVEREREETEQQVTNA